MDWLSFLRKRGTDEEERERERAFEARLRELI